MAEVPRIGVEEARRKVEAGEALLVCAYDDEGKCAAMQLDGAMPLAELERRGGVPRGQELVFYCA